MRQRLLYLLYVPIIMSLLALALVWSRAAGADLPTREEITLSEDFSASLWACHVPQKSAVILDVEERVFLGKPMILVRTDRNYDGQQDMVLFYDYKEGQQATFPHYYVYDTNFDGLPDKAYRDVNGNGVCQEIQEVPIKYVMEMGKDS